jgi:four helix bundle protein
MQHAHALAMSDESEQLKKRTMQFALSVCGLLHELPSQEPGPTIRHQLAKSSTGMAFNYRASCRARSHAEYTARIGLVAEEADETQGWLEFIRDASLLSSRKTEHFISEAIQLTKIFSASVKTARAKERNGRR